MKLIYKVLMIVSVALVSTLAQAKKKKLEPRTCENYYIPIRRSYRKSQTQECKRSQYRGVFACRTYLREQLCKKNQNI